MKAHGYSIGAHRVSQDVFTAHRIKIAKRTLEMSDAGAMIMGGYVPEFSTKAGVPWIKRWRASFALLPDAIVVPHYDEFPEVMVSLIFGRRPQGTYLIGVDRNTALVGLDHTWQVLGAGRVTVRRGRDAKRYTAGQAVSLNP